MPSTGDTRISSIDAYFQYPPRSSQQQQLQQQQLKAVASMAASPGRRRLQLLARGDGGVGDRPASAGASFGGKGKRAGVQRCFFFGTDVLLSCCWLPAANQLWLLRGPRENWLDQ